MCSGTTPSWPHSIAASVISIRLGIASQLGRVSDLSRGLAWPILKLDGDPCHSEEDWHEQHNHNLGDLHIPRVRVGSFA